MELTPLKAAALKALERNAQRNKRGTNAVPGVEQSTQKNTHLFHPKTGDVPAQSRVPVYGLDTHANEKQSNVIYWRFIHNGIEVDFASGATVTEAYDLLRCEPDDELVPMIEYDNEDEDGTGAK